MRLLSSNQGRGLRIEFPFGRAECSLLFARSVSSGWEQVNLLAKSRLSLNNCNPSMAQSFAIKKPL